MADLFVVDRTSGRRTTDARPSAPDSWAVVRVALIVLAVVGSLWVVYELGTVIILVLFAVLFAYLMAPLVAFFQRRLAGGGRRELPRGAAIGIAYVVVFAAVALLVAWIAPYVTDAAKQVPQWMQTARASGQPFKVVNSWLSVIGVSGTMVNRAVSSATGAVEAAAHWIATEFVHLAGYLPWLVLVPVLALFLLKDAQSLTQGAIALLPARWRVHGPAVLDRIDAALAAYIRAQLVACLLVGAVVGVGFTALKVPFAAILGVAAGLAEFVPLVGPLVIALLSIAIAALRAPMSAVWVLLFLGVLRVLEDYVIYPRLVGSTVHLHPLAVILGVVAGGELGGVVGVLLSVPALAIASALYRYARESSGEASATRGIEQPPRVHHA